jgi:hypothetical protein
MRSSRILLHIVSSCVSVCCAVSAFNGKLWPSTCNCRHCYKPAISLLTSFHLAHTRYCYYLHIYLCTQTLAPDGLNHDTLLDAQSRAGKEPGWWVQCTQDLIVRYITADRSLITGQQSGKQLQCAAKPSCHGLVRMEKQTPVMTTSNSKKKSSKKSKQVWTQVDELTAAAAAPTAA